NYDCRSRAVFSECFDSHSHRYQAVIAEASDAADRIDCVAVAQPLILGQSRVGVCGQPFFNGKGIAPGTQHNEPAILASKCRRLSVAGYQNVWLGRVQGPSDRACGNEAAAPTQRCTQEANQ